jgi:phage/plasmid-like protein (TIGR03299 family)
MAYAVYGDEAQRRRLVPWHGLGTAVEGAMDAETAIREGGLDWSVEQFPAFTFTLEGMRRFDEGMTTVSLAQGAGLIQQDEGSWFNVRSDTGAILGRVGSQHTPLQNIEAFEFMDALVSDGEARYETVGPLWGGKRIWLLARNPEPFDIAGDEFLDYWLLSNDHSGSASLEVGDCLTRVVCWNTWRVARGEARHTWRTRHTPGIQAKAAAAAEALRIRESGRAIARQTAEELLGQKLSGRRLDEFAQALFPVENEESKIANRNAEERRAVLRSILQGAPDLDNYRQTAWGAFQAVLEYSNHARTFQGGPEARMASVMYQDGNSAQLNERALELLLAGADS